MKKEKGESRKERKGERQEEGRGERMRPEKREIKVRTGKKE